MDQDLLFEALSDFGRVLVETSDVKQVLHELVVRSAEVSGVAGAGVSLLAPDGLTLTTALDESTVRIEQAQAAARRGPSIDAHRGGEPVVVTDLTGCAERWPEVAAAATEVGVHAAAAIPMRVGGEAVGVLDLYDLEAREWSEEELRAARWLAEMATAYVLLAARVRRAETLATQLQHALDSRVVIEQAKGILAGRLDVDMDHSFAILRNHARNHNLALTEVARSVADGSLLASRLDAPVRLRRARSGRRRSRRAG